MCSFFYFWSGLRLQVSDVKSSYRRINEVKRALERMTRSKSLALATSVILSHHECLKIVIFAREWFICLLENPVHCGGNCSFDGLPSSAGVHRSIENRLLSVSSVRASSMETGIGGAIWRFLRSRGVD